MKNVLCRQAILWGLLVFVVLFFVFSSSARAAVPTPIDSSWKLIFADEFSGTSLNMSVWKPTRQWSKPDAITRPLLAGEIAAYDPAQTTVAGGNLRLTVIDKPVKVSTGQTYQYRTGFVSTYDSKWFEPPYYAEARIYSPAAAPTVVANFPAWWIKAKTVGLDDLGGEVDIYEGIQGKPHTSYHLNTVDYDRTKRITDKDYTGWHIFAAKVEVGKVTYYYDGVEVFKVTSPHVLDAARYLVLGLQLGGNSPRVVPSTMLVDYVHVYSNSPKAVAVPPPAGYGGQGSGTVGGGAPSNPTTPTTPVGGLFPVLKNGDRIELFRAANVRSAPQISASTLKGINTHGTRGTVTDGPEPGPQGRSWYDINFDTGFDGWVVNDNYTKITSAITQTTPSYFKVGDRVRLFRASNVRSSAAIATNLIGVNSTGAIGTITEGPTKNGAINWYNINFDTGHDGWVASDNYVIAQ